MTSTILEGARATRIDHQSFLVRSWYFWFSLCSWIMVVIFTIFFGALATGMGVVEHVVARVLRILYLPPAVLNQVAKASFAVHYVAMSWGKCVLWVTGGRLTVEGKANLFKNGPVIYVINHQSMYDIPLLYHALGRRQFRWMAKAALFKIPFFGWGMSGAGYIPVERGSKSAAMRSLYGAAERVRQGASVLVFPEGTRTTLGDGEMLPFKGGGFILAKKAGVTIQPITIWGSNRVVPKQNQALMQRVYPGPVRAIVHPPIPPSEYERLGVEELSRKCRAILQQPIPRLRQELPL